MSISQNRHNLKKAKKKANRLACIFYRDITDKSWIKKMTNHLYRNRKPCSCHMCGNPRRSEWNKKKSKLTLQEKRFYEY